MTHSQRVDLEKTSRDRTKIGKFGVGFKSVYSYTSSPEIHSGQEHFRIERHLWPRGIAPRPIAPCETLFILPFDHASVSAEAAFHEIGPCLKDLDLRTMLFLKHIKQIEWHIVGSTNGSYLRDDPPEGKERRVTIIGESTGSSTIEEWLVFERSVIDSGQNLRVQAAFLLAGSKALADERIVDAGNCPLIVFFPTDKGTHLHFLIQGPYNTTTARDNVHDDDDLNRFLIKETAELVGWTLPRLRDMGLLSVSLLEALPIREQDFPFGTTFRPIYDAVREAFGQHELLPAHPDGFIRGNQARLADGPLRQLVSAEQLRALLRSTGPMHWLSELLTIDRSRELYSYLKEALKIPEIAPIDFVRMLTSEFLSGQTDTWMIDLYAFLDRQRLSAGPLLTLLRQKPIIRLEDGGHVAPLSDTGAPQVYLPGTAITSFPTVKREIAADERARSFLLQLRLTEADLVDESLNNVLPKYERRTVPTEEDVLCADMEILLQALALTSSRRYTELRHRLECAPLIRVVTASGDDPPSEDFPEVPMFRRPGEVYLRSLELERYFRWDGIQGVFPHPYYDRFGNRLAELGFKRELKPSSRAPGGGNYVSLLDDHGKNLRGVNGFDPRAEVDELYIVLGTATWDDDWIEQATFIWNRIAVPYSSLIRGVVEYSTRKDFTYPERRDPDYSTFGKLLVETKWLPDSSGALHRPAGMALEDLPDGFQPNEQAALQLGMKPSLIGKFAEASGYAPHEVTILLEKKPEVRAALERAGILKTGGNGNDGTVGPAGDELIDYGEELKTAFSRDGQLPVTGDVSVPGVVPDPARRRERTEGAVRTRRAEEPEQEARYRVAHRRVWEEPNEEVRTFLRQQYGGKCQICQLAPFARRDGEPYFTSVYLVSRTKGRWIDRPGNALCLCPNCFAKFVFGAFEAEDIGEKIASFKMLREGGDRILAMQITLCGRPATIRYSERHMIDLQALLTVSTEKIAAVTPFLLAAGA
ncbi:MAG: hypothetical protein ACR2QA_10815 [Solirubrobacteraceae bacterium]